MLTVTGSVLPVSTLYDALYRVVSITDGRLNTTSYGYSPAGFLATVAYPNGDSLQTTNWDYDSNVLSVTDGRSAVHIYVYNELETHLTSVICAGAPSAAPSYSYDIYGRLSTVSKRQTLMSRTVFEKSFSVKGNCE